uniref:Rieske [2Fe-2S] domain-containing protein n=1 Tax=Candidatus Kentrum sp. LPFa TaxID=2126335 RepID=A0A450WC45_9GAMM|nr:MAG: Rieske [2Fe-2S] domain-containing protein [Candidatus Kentron sp. LPFa]VFK30367.1 MAG: Rieske [2Fe-2S] domain-containing protein [Candidatus Kentron sp. LPFa]
MMNPDNLIVDDRERGLFRYHRSLMTSPRILEQEREKIFGKCWLYLGHESELPNAGDYQHRSVAGRSLIFIRGNDGQIRAFFNTCTHRGATICRQDRGNEKLLQCPYHAWSFDNQGNLVGIPGREAYSGHFDPGELALRQPAQVDNYRGLYFETFARKDPY